MKMFFKIIKYRFISSLIHPVVLVCLSAALVSSVSVGIHAHRSETDTSLYPIAIVDEDGGEYAEMFIERISGNKQIDVQLLDKDKAFRQVSTGRLDGAFILLDGFSEKIAENDYSEIVEFITPSATTSAYPVSEIVSSEIMDIWLLRLVEDSLKILHSELGKDAQISYEEAIAGIEDEYVQEEIISIEYIGNDRAVYKKPDIRPIDKAVGIYAAFVIFAVMLSGEWIFNIKKRDMQSRFISKNISLPMVCLASQVASVLVSMVFFIPLIVFLSVYLSVGFLTGLYMTAGMLLYLLSICSIAFAVSALAENLTQLVVLGTSISIINILISSLVMPMPEWAVVAGGMAKLFPGTYLMGCYDDLSRLFVMLLIALLWAGAGNLFILRLRKRARG